MFQNTKAHLFMGLNQWPNCSERKCSNRCETSKRYVPQPDGTLGSAYGLKQPNGTLGSAYGLKQPDGTLGSVYGLKQPDGANICDFCKHLKKVVLKLFKLKKCA